MSRTGERAKGDVAPRRGERLLLILVTFVGAPLLVCLFASLRIYSVPSGSMLPTIKQGSYMVASRASYGYSRYSFDSFDLPIAGRWPAMMPQRGDVIVFRLVRDRDTSYVKRVVGLPGDRVQMIGGRLSLNGALVPIEPLPASEPAAGGRGAPATYVEKLPGGASYSILKAGRGFLDDTPELVVPAGHLFVLGDNRDESNDSRDRGTTGVGYVDVARVIGRIIFPF